MPRYARIVAPNLFYHIINRGIEKRSIFRNDDDYGRFLQYIKSYGKKYDWIIYCYCLMPNHYHLLIQTHLDPLGLIMKSLQTAYGVFFNKKYKRVGPVFSGRYKSIICQDDEYMLQISKYIHLNPVKAKLCKNPSNYPYSSYQEYIKANDSASVDIIDRRAMRRVIGDTITKESISIYKSFVEENEDLFEYNPLKTSIDIVGNDRFMTKLRRIA